MFFILWGIINLALFLFFIVTCFKATKLIREKAGLFTAIIFVFGLLSFVSSANSKDDNREPNKNEIKKWKFVSEDSLYNQSTHVLQVELEKTLIATYNLGIIYGQDKQQNRNVAISANSSTTGFISGTSWKPIAINVNTTSDNKRFQYAVSGILEWQLLGATLYSQPKNYAGFANID